MAGWRSIRMRRGEHQSASGVLQCTPHNGVPSSQVELLCKKRSLLRKKGGYVLVGDRVEVVSIDWQDGRALVSNVLPRKTETANPRVANVDHLALVFSLLQPPFEAFQVTRFLVAAEGAGISCSLVLNKCDLVDSEVVQEVVDRVADWGYTAIPTSVQSGMGLDKVRNCTPSRCPRQ
jgi:ribosome biogenesis GTPase / thiamine phosphate phosphatase